MMPGPLVAVDRLKLDGEVATQDDEREDQDECNESERDVYLRHGMGVPAHAAGRGLFSPICHLPLLMRR